MITVNAGNFTMGGARGGSGTATSLTVDERGDPQGRPRRAVPRSGVFTGPRSWPRTRTGSRAFRGPMSTSRSFARGRRASARFSARRTWPAPRRWPILGSTVSEMLFGRDSDSVGQVIRIRNQPFKVIGVMGSKGQGMGEDMDNQILVPIRLCRRSCWVFSTFRASRSGRLGRRNKPGRRRIAILLRARHQVVPGQSDDFMIRTLEEMADIRTQAMGTMTTLLAGIAGVSLLVGGIGIMNIMLVSVTERTREIGLRKAVGAKGRDVLLQFLVEAIAISLLGGGIGIVLGFGLAEGMSRWMSWPAQVPADAVVMAFGFAAATGIFFGFYPAQKAARLDPIDALRYE